MNSIAVNGSYAYVAVSNSLGTSSVQIVDLSNPAAPQIVSSYVTSTPPKGVRVLGNLLYVAENGTFEIIDVSSPLSPRLLGSASAILAAPSGTLVYGVSGIGVRQYDASLPTAPLLLATQLDGNLSINTLDAAGLYAVSGSQISFNSSIGYLTSYLFHGTPTNTNASLQLPQFAHIGAVRIVKDYIAAATSNGLVVTNAADRLLWSATRSGFNLSSTDGGGSPIGSIDIVDRFVGTIGDGSAFLFDSTTQNDPQLRASLLFTDVGDPANPRGIALTPTLMLTTTVSGHADGSVTARLFVTRYRTITDTRGVAPAVALTAPRAGMTAKSGHLVSFQAAAIDDVAVASVVFTVNGVDLFTDTIAPYEFNYLVPSGTPAFTVTARAIDYGGNATTSAPVTVSVTP